MPAIRPFTVATMQGLTRIVFDISNMNDPRRTGIGRVTESILRGILEVMNAGEWRAGELICVSCWPHLVEPEVRGALEKHGVRFEVLPFRSMYLYRCYLLPGWAKRRGASLVLVPEPVFSLLPFLPPYSIVVHDMLHHDDPSTLLKHIWLIYRMLLPRTVRKARRIASISRFTADRLSAIQRGRTAPIDVIPMVCSTGNVADPPATLPPDIPERFALFVGNLIPRKNIRRLASCFAKVKRERPDCFVPLVVVGASQPAIDPIDDFLAEHAEAGVVFRTGFVSDDELEALYRRAQFFCFPSTYEGYGLPIIESMALGTPVITARGTSTEEAAGGAALLVNATSEEEITAALLRLGSDAALREDLRRRGLERAAQLTHARLGAAIHEFLLKSLAC